MRLEQRQFTATDGAKINYVNVGNGRPLVYVNGFGEDASSAHRIIERWSETFQCISFEHRGYGKSELGSDFGVQRSASDLRELLEYLGLTDVTLVGYSMGGSVAFSYIQQFGTSLLGRLVLADTSPKLINESTWNLGLWQGRYRREDFVLDLETIINNPMLFHLSFYGRAATRTRYDDVELSFPSYDDLDGWINYVAELTKIKTTLVKRIFAFEYSMEMRKAVRRYWETMTGGDWRSVLNTIDIPTICVYANPGSFYYSATADYMVAQIPFSRSVAIENSCHTFPKDNFGEFVDIVTDFCRQSR